MNETTVVRNSVPAGTVQSSLPRRLALMIAWSRAEPERVGEIAFCPSEKGDAPMVLGRGAGAPDEAEARLSFVRQSPGRNRPMPPLASDGLSRRQLRVSYASGASGASLDVEVLGRVKTLFRGREVEQATLCEGDAITLEGQLVLLVCRRPMSIAEWAFGAPAEGVFGKPDAHGIVGESALSWELREQLAFAAGRDLHVLVLGESGVGKELAAQAIHSMSAVSDKDLVSRNAATMPVGLVDAELFGNVRDYPNPGMRERAGLIGEADGSTLFLDEIGELPEEMQARLLRVLDSGEYQRLGEDRRRASKFRLVAATNRDPDSLKHDVLARFALHVHLPNLNDRREDIPLLVDHLLIHTRAQDDALDRFFDGDRPRVAPILIERLLGHDFDLNIRELMTTLWKCIQQSRGEWIELPDDVARGLKVRDGERYRSSEDISPEEIQKALLEHAGVLEDVWRALGLKNRHVLRRLIKKHKIEL